jgi:lysophospholipid acyltransferase (LPLAT)-like uncharacterized protein
MKIRNRRLTRLLAFLAVCLLRVLYWTCRKKYILHTPGTLPYLDSGDQRYIYSLWHDQLLMAIFTGRPIRMCGLVSRHQDGSYLSDGMRMVGVTPVRGSHQHGGAEAMRQMIERVRDYHIAITPDGPRGPRREIKPGIAFLASRTGRVVVPVGANCANCWKVQGKWTDMMIPKPFTTIYTICGEPLAIPADATREQLEEYTRELTERMRQVEIDVERFRAGELDEQPIPVVPSPEAAPLDRTAA